VDDGRLQAVATQGGFHAALGTGAFSLSTHCAMIQLFRMDSGRTLFMCSVDSAPHPLLIAALKNSHGLHGLHGFFIPRGAGDSMNVFQ
jgi:hypothetical protein